MKAIKKYLQKIGLMKLRARVLLLGLSNSGKTTVVKAIAGRLNQGVAPTMGYEVETTKLKRVKVTTLDMSGQLKYQSLWDNFYDECNGVIFVIDASDSGSLTDVKAIFMSVMTKLKTKNVPVLLLCNKMDVSGAQQPEAIVEQLEAKQLVGTKRLFHVLPCIAVASQGVQEAMSWMTDSIRRSI